MPAQQLADEAATALAQLPHREIVKVHIATEKRISELVRGKKKPGEVVVAV